MIFYVMAHHKRYFEDVITVVDGNSFEIIVMISLFVNWKMMATLVTHRNSISFKVF